MSVYRFRKVENLLGKYQELKNQEIYFSDLESLNDPMEGHRRYFWAGDKIAWKNLFTHYIICLNQLCVMAYLSNEKSTFTSKDIPVFMNIDELPTKDFKTLVDSIIKEFFKTDGIEEYIEFISHLPWDIDREELYSYLKSIHIIAFLIIMKKHRETGLNNSSSDIELQPLIHFRKFIDLVKNIGIDKEKNQDEVRIALKIKSKFLMDMDLISACNLYGDSLDQRRWFILYDFTNSYLCEIEEITYPEAYVACFMDKCTNSAVWGHYGDSHKGVCLKFKTDDSEGKSSINLRCIIGVGDKPIYGNRRFQFHNINYSNEFQSVDFFKSIGRLPYNKLIKNWFTDQHGNISICAGHLKDKDNQETWRKNYWKNYGDGFITKLKDWKYENEKRLLLESSLDLYVNTKNRKLKYQFEDLEAIIFGMKTSVEDKVKIIKIIESKCIEHKRSDFKFYQAEYSQMSAKMDIRELSLMKLKSE